MIIKDFVEKLKYKFLLNDLFFMQGKLPKTDNEKYWFSKGLKESVNDLIIYKKIIDTKYKDLVKRISELGFTVMYDEITHRHIIKKDEFLN